MTCLYLHKRWSLVLSFVLHFWHLLPGLGGEGDVSNFFSLDGPKFNESIHLALRRPDRIVRMADFAANQERYNAPLVSDFAQTGLFNVLSSEGMRILSSEIDRLEKFAVESPRIPRVLRGATFRSRFIYDLCHSKVLANFMSSIAGTELIAHPMEIMNAHINLAPKDLTRAIDRWHHDTTPFVLIIFCTPPEEYEGGEFEFFYGTKAEAEALLSAQQNYRQSTVSQSYNASATLQLRDAKGDDLPSPGTSTKVIESNGTRAPPTLPGDRCRTLGRPSAGTGVLQQGSEVYHRAKRVTRGSRRTTFVQSFVPTAMLGLPQVEEAGSSKKTKEQRDAPESLVWQDVDKAGARGRRHFGSDPNILQGEVPDARRRVALEACDRLSDTYNGVDPMEVLLPDWARFRLWRALRLCEQWLEDAHEEDKDEDSSVSVYRYVSAEKDCELTSMATAVSTVVEKFRVILSQSLPYGTPRSKLSAVLSDAADDLLRLIASRDHVPEGGDTGGQSNQCEHDRSDEIPNNGTPLDHSCGVKSPSLPRDHAVVHDSLLGEAVATLVDAARDVTELATPTMTYF